MSKPALSEFLQWSEIENAMRVLPESLRWAEADLTRYGKRPDAVAKPVRAGGRRGAAAPPIWRRKEIEKLFRKVWKGHASDLAERFVAALNAAKAWH